MTAHHPNAPFISGLSEIAARYPAIICDVWGVLHNGATATPGAADALAAFRRQGGRVSLLTNAPRPAAVVREQLLNTYRVPEDAFDTIVTSGDVTTELLRARGPIRLHHIGPERDLALYDGITATLSDAGAADLVVTTGLFDDETETPEDYRDRLAPLVARGLTLICANPDLVVERGGTLVHCAGGIARVYRDLGGSVIYVGKPHRPVYDVARSRLSALVGRPVAGADILAIGDGMPTDVAGAHAEGLDLLFVTAGIHAGEFGDHHAPDPVKVGEKLRAAGVRAAGVLPRLGW